MSGSDNFGKEFLASESLRPSRILSKSHKVHIMLLMAIVWKFPTDSDLDRVIWLAEDSSVYKHNMKPWEALNVFGEDLPMLPVREGGIYLEELLA